MSSSKKVADRLIKIFPYIVKGTILDEDVFIPFLTLVEIDKYAESLAWACSKYNCDINLEIYNKDMGLVGKIVYKPETVN